MIKCKVELKFDDKSVHSLAGYEFGLSVYKEQVKEIINYAADEIIITFPDDKSKIADSFVEGFFDEIKKNIGITGIKAKIKVETKYDSMKAKIYESLYIE